MKQSIARHFSAGVWGVSNAAFFAAVGVLLEPSLKGFLITPNSAVTGLQFRANQLNNFCVKQVPQQLTCGGQAWKSNHTVHYLQNA